MELVPKPVADTRLRHLPLMLILLVTGTACDGRGQAGGASDAEQVERAERAAAAARALGPGADIDAGHALGRPDAPIAVVEFSDFGCPYCGRFARTTLPEIRQEYVREGMVRWRYVPVIYGFAGGELMGKAAECAAELAGQEGFWRVHDLLYRNQVALRGAGARDRVLGYLEELGLERGAVAQCLDDPEIARRLQQNTALAEEWYVRGTPTFVINGVPVSGALPLDFFRKMFATAVDPSGL